MNKLVSVVIPVKNGLPYIKETLESVLRQSYNHIEVIVVDDSSDDETVNCIKKNYPTVILLENKSSRHGAPVCRNIGHQASKGEYVIFVDADDILSTNCVQHRVSKMESNPDCDFYVFQCELFKKKPGDIGLYWNYFSNEDDLDRFIRVDTPWHTTSPIWKKSAITLLGGWDESALAWQDWEFHIRALIANLNYKKEPVVDFYYRKEVNNSISTKDGTLERTLYFSVLFSKIYIYLINSEKLTNKRKDYLLIRFFKLSLYCLNYFNNVNYSIDILKNAYEVNLINRLSVYYISYMLFFFTRKNYFLKKIGWVTLKPYLLKAFEKDHPQNADILFKE